MEDGIPKPHTETVAYTPHSTHRSMVYTTHPMQRRMVYTTPHTKGGLHCIPQKENEDVQYTQKGVHYIPHLTQTGGVYTIHLIQIQRKVVYTIHRG